jgi:DNA-binding transcriptional MerR regulator
MLHAIVQPVKKILVKDAARLLNVTPARVRQMENAGSLRAERIGSMQTRVFDVDDVKRLKAERAAKKTDREK